MTRDRTKFIILKKNEANVTFANNGSSKILGKGTLSLHSGIDKVEKVLCFEKLKHNILSISQMCDQGHILTFDSRECEIRKTNLGKLVAK